MQLKVNQLLYPAEHPGPGGTVESYDVQQLQPWMKISLLPHIYDSSTASIQNEHGLSTGGLCMVFLHNVILYVVAGAGPLFIIHYAEGLFLHFKINLKLYLSLSSTISKCINGVWSRSSYKSTCILIVIIGFGIPWW